MKKSLEPEWFSCHIDHMNYLAEDFFVETVLGCNFPSFPMISNLQLGPFDTRNPTQFWDADMAAMAFVTSHGSNWGF